ncbi:cyanophycin synthetase [Thermoanaerobacter thermohydrosulfuricus]|uniref:Cyanophycin synthetase n=1 Tax=Thermoanaerobacter thermohydrosulfuricus TaxID=1516 RepID=A0A1G7SVH9_THETY|nr:MULTISPECIES: cyanophycin synthetase [Thermoanaerobacter]UZQ83000.1 cyanophycin synthetase [Thermoanaerobacter sp. RKWS2]SDG26968.1 cyanophycin synthetase [Thermoanaerobacter thermohydrosulfuricus]
MIIKDIRVYRGRNIYSHRPVIKMVVDIERLDIPTKDIPNFNERLIKRLPGLSKHSCSYGYEGGFLKRLEEGTYLPHVTEHIILELQNMLGYDVKFGRARNIEGDLYYIIYEYGLEECGIRVGKLAVEMVNKFIQGEEFDLEERLERIRNIIAEIELGPSTMAIKNEALKAGIPVTRVGNGSILRLGYGKYQKMIEGTISQNTSCIAVDIASDKILTKQILRDHGFPVPEGDVAYNEEEAIAIAEEIGYPVAIKPYNGNQGKGVHLNITNKEEVSIAYRNAKAYSDLVIVEKHIKGKHYRVLVVGEKVVAVAEKIPAHVIGDGIHTIEELVEIENKNPLRGKGHEKPLTKLTIDTISKMTLKKQGFDLEEIPKKGQKVFLRESANLSTGGIAIDKTDDIHPYNIEIAVRAAKAIGLDIAGIDITMEDIKKPLTKENGAIIEINASPGIRMHHYPSKGKPRNVAKAIVDMLFPKGSKATIPIISITGTNGKTTVTRMTAHILKTYGYTVGMTCTDGIYIDDTCVYKGDNTGPKSARTCLADKNIDAAVLETARGGIIREGLGYDLADVGVITNISEDHLGIDGIETLEDLAFVKALVVEAVKEDGYSVLNADDPMTTYLAQRAKGKIIYFSMYDNNLTVKKHIEKGGIAVYVKDGVIVIANGQIIPVVKIEEIPAALSGKVLYNVENALAAIAASYGVKVPVNIIAKGIKTFYCDTTHNPGRFNLFNVGNFRVLVDYGHNIAGIKSVIEAAQKLDANRLIGVIGVPGDRINSSILKVGEICGQGFDFIYVKEDLDLRGRKPGEVAKLLEQGAIKGGIDRKKIKTILKETEALRAAMYNAEGGDLIVVFYEKYQPIIEVIEEFIKNKDLKNIEIKLERA